MLRTHFYATDEILKKVDILEVDILGVDILRLTLFLHNPSHAHSHYNMEKILSNDTIFLTQAKVFECGLC